MEIRQPEDRSRKRDAETDERLWESKQRAGGAEADEEGGLSEDAQAGLTKAHPINESL